ncbi:MAG TPA: hypothetical protein VHA09_06400 [Nitrososphaera sp.]|nr:hypothetical protein [Nitrososphaera sp.]
MLTLFLVPFFAGFKVAKFSAKLIKRFKVAKSGFNAARGAKRWAVQKVDHNTYYLMSPDPICQ